MRAVWYERQGPPRDVLTLGELPMPEPAAGEVRMRLMASAINPSDCNRRAGRGYGMEYPRIVPHSDGAGIVDAVGGDVPDEWRGRRVWLYNGQRGRAFGTAAEFICVPLDLVSPLPDNTTFAEGACLGIPCMTAHYCVFADGPVEGKSILVAGGGGAVGNYAIQFAKRGGARVIATVDAEWKEADARRAGADSVIQFHREDVAGRVLDLTAGNGVDRIVEVDFGGNLETNLKVIRANGAIIAYASRGNATPTLPFYPLMRKNLTIRGVLLPGTPIEVRRRAQREIVRWLEDGQAFHRVAATYPLAQSALAHEAVESNTKRGTVVVLPDR